MENKTLYKTKFLELKEAIRENGSPWTYAHRPNVKDIAVIVPVIKKEDGEYVLFLITKRPPILAENKAVYCLEIPAGLVGDTDKNENTIDALRRELKEESGYESNDIKIVSKKVSSSAGMTSETSTIAIAYIDDAKPPLPTDDDNGVIIERKLVKKEDILNFIKDFEVQGNALGAQTLSGLFYYFTN